MTHFFSAFSSTAGFLILSVAALLGCGKSPSRTAETVARLDKPHDVATGVRVIAANSARSNFNQEKLFKRLGPAQTGVDFTIRWDKPAEYDRVFYSQNSGGGVSIADYDQDGLPDIFLTRPSGGNRLYRNRGELRYDDVTEQAGMRDDAFWGTGAGFVDIDNDGDLDLYACSYAGENRLYVNQGDGSFQLEAGAFGLDFRGASVMMAFADYDRDGDLDGYLVTAGLPPGDKKFRVRFDGKRPVVREELQEYWELLYLPGDKAKQIEAGQFDRLYRNDGVGPDGKLRFVEVAKSSGIVGTDIGQSATWWDFNGDAWPDLYVANDYWGADRLYRNNGDGTFTDIAKTALPHTPWSSMGADIGDINQDGLMDLLATDMAGSNHFRQKVGMGDMANAGWFLEYAEPRQYSRNALYVNTGTHRFMEAAYLTDLGSSDWTWTPRFEDFDNDGLIDVLITNGMTRDFTNSDVNELAKKAAKEGSPEFFAFWRRQGFRKDANLIFRNQGDLRFENKSQEWGFDRMGVSFGAATADLDLDGDLDIVVNNMDVPAQIYRNDSATGNTLRIKLAGTNSNRSALGSLVKVRAGGTEQVRYLTLSRGWNSTSEPILHFGLGDETKADVMVRWPDGKTQEIGQLAANQVYEITEMPNEQSTGPVTPAAPYFDSSRAIDELNIVHYEAQFDDFMIQPLLPNKLSQLGPGLACADINGDGYDDIYVGGGYQQTATLLMSGKEGYQVDAVPAFERHAECEDMGALFFDADSDGDMDLYVVSGGAQRPEGNALLRDRLYRNDNGQFVVSDPSVLPSTAKSGSAVTAADFDRDGDLDLFVGTRVLPAFYPSAPASQLLQNNGGTFTDVTKRLAGGLQRSGLVTSACWSDVNADGWPDLMATYEWGPVRCFLNRQGRLEDATTDAGLANLLGWWNGAAGGDVDNDGDIDFVVTNFGLNTKYHASPEHPTRIYYGDYDGSGKNRIVEAEFEGEKLFPVRGKSCSTNAIPILGDRFKTFTDFGIAELDEIYTDNCLQDAERFEVNTLESGVLINDGSGHFQFRPLPRIAQIAPTFGTALIDVDYDGNLDLYLAQNFYSPQRETGRMDGGVSLLLMGIGDGTWEPVWPNQSGIVVGEDATAALATDLNKDGFTDLLVTVNAGKLRGFEGHKISSENKVLQIRLAGPPGNPTGIGARLTMTDQQQSHRVHEIQSTAGYLTQRSSEAVFAVDASVASVTLQVQWPQGKTTSHVIELERRQVQGVTIRDEKEHAGSSTL